MPKLTNNHPSALQQLIRTIESHKGLYGHVAIIGGASGMVGAALLAGRAALHLGAGKVSLGLLDKSIAVDIFQPELMITDASELLNTQSLTHLLVGPGLGQSDTAIERLTCCLQTTLPLIIDADGLNLIAQYRNLKQILRLRNADTLITPHPTEAARLLGCSTQNVQLNRSEAAEKLSQELNCTTVLKGHQTLICCHNGMISQNCTGNSALSSAGQGDVLGGIILALWAQGLPLADASYYGVYLHGRAADLWRESNPNGIGLTASETILLARKQLNRDLSILSEYIDTRIDQ